MTAKPLLICLMGPTASGKTALAVELAERLRGELVSVDATLVYRTLDIGSAKPAYPHRLIDIRDPAEPYSAADFVDDARRAVTAISAAGRLPILVGGTMLYFKAALEGLAVMPPADPVIRAEIAAEARARGWPQLHRDLAAVDPAAAARIHPNHTQRLGRALEVYRASGTALSEWQRAGAGRAWTLGSEFRVLQLALAPAERAVLHARIASRFDDMLAAGLLEEVRRLRQRGDLHPGLPAIRAVGYRQLWQHLDGEISLDEAVRKAVAATRQLAKRQFTWLRKWPDLAWIHTDGGNRVLHTDWDARCPGQCGLAPCEAVLNYLALEAPKQK